MIVKTVQKVDSCRKCPNLRTKDRGMEEDYICLASMKKIGTSSSSTSQHNLKNKVSDLCPFAEDEVNQRPTRER